MRTVISRGFVLLVQVGQTSTAGLGWLASYYWGLSGSFWSGNVRDYYKDYTYVTHKVTHKSNWRKKGPFSKEAWCKWEYSCNISHQNWVVSDLHQVATTPGQKFPQKILPLLPSFISKIYGTSQRNQKSLRSLKYGMIIIMIVLELGRCLLIFWCLVCNLHSGRKLDMQWNTRGHGFLSTMATWTGQWLGPHEDGYNISGVVMVKLAWIDTKRCWAHLWNFEGLLPYPKDGNSTTWCWSCRSNLKDLVCLAQLPARCQWIGQRMGT
jgi:hypothetical protein